MRLSERLRRLLVGAPFGDLTGRPDVLPGSVDGRTAALRVLRLYLAEVVFWRSGGEGKRPFAFRVPRERLIMEWPDREVDVELPSIVVEPGTTAYQAVGMGNMIDESTTGKFAPRTALMTISTVVETIQLQVWGSSKAERRAMKRGLEDAFSPTEYMSGIRLRMPDYFNQVATFSLNGGSLSDGEQSGRGYRMGSLEVEMRYTQVKLVAVSPLRPIVVVEAIGEDVKP